MIKSKIYRILLLPFGFFKGIVELSNSKARDLQNKIKYSQSIIDDNCSFTSNVKIGKGSHILRNAIINNSSIGKYSYCNKNVLIQNAEIGNYCSIASDVIIGLGNHPLHLFSTATLFYKAKNTLRIQLRDNDYDFDEYKKIFIEHDVWIGARAIIMDGVKIGTGSVIAAGSVVTKDVPPYAIVAGVPAKVIKYRFNTDKISYLIKSRWWTNEPREVFDSFKNFNHL